MTVLDRMAPSSNGNGHKKNNQVMVRLNAHQYRLLQQAAQNSPLATYIVDVLVAHLEQQEHKQVAPITEVAFWQNFFAAVITAPKDLSYEDAHAAFPEMVLAQPPQDSKGE